MKVAALGDSITYGYPYGKGWVSILSEETEHHYINAGLNGDTLWGMYNRLKEDVITQQPEVCFVTGGTNDVLQGYSEEQMQKNFRLICEALGEADIKIIAGIPIPLLLEDFDERLQPLRQFIKKKYECTVDFHSCFYDGHRVKAGLIYDGAHPSDEGYRLMANAARKVLDTIQG